jgi:DNA-binding MarR family transcriptional regulator
MLAPLREPFDHGHTAMATSSSARFTEKQGQYLAFIHTYALLNRRPPAEADMERYFGVTPPSVHRMIVELERRGLIRRVPRQARSIELLIEPEALPPLQGQTIKTSVARY